MTVTTTIVQRRIAIAGFFCVMAFALIGVRLADLTLLKGKLTAMPEPEARATVARADIVDRNGQLLARDLPVSDFYIEPAAFKNKPDAARALSAASGIEEARFERLFASKFHHVLVARQLTPDVVARLNALKLAGMEFDPAMKRYYPLGIEAAQVIGSTDMDDNGVDGIEKGLDARLRSMPANMPVTLSLDMRVQYALAQEVEAAREQYAAKVAGGIVMDVNSGEILAMASLPNTGNGTGAEDPRRNHMATDDYELGSVFKIFTFAMAMQDHTTRLDEMFPIGAGYKIGKYTIHDAEHMPAMLAARDILALSSNPGTAQIALRSGPTRQHQFLADMGLLAPVHTELAESRGPMVPANWGEIETATIGFGHGISVTPLSFVAAAASVVNGGRRIQPTFLKRDGDARGEQVISPETSEIMRGLLRYVVTNGTGKLADVPGYDVGGKTGSAEKNVHGRYVAHKLLTSFCAVFPIDHPRYLVFVMLDEPGGANATGVMALAGHTAAPLAGRVIARIAPILEVPANMLAQDKGTP
jgi:cell division protein FtsI (penicillin-binding protein 3)